MLASFSWDSFFKFLPDILKSAAASPLGILALAIIAVAIVLVFLGRGLPPLSRSTILILVLLGLGGLSWKLVSLSQTLPTERGTIEPPSEPVTLEKTPHSAVATTAVELPTGLAKHHLIGTDMSHYDHVDWSRISETPIAFIFLRASQGSDHRDPAFAANWRAAGEAQILRGAYHFFVADQDGGAQAANFLSALAQVGATRAELPAALDLEEVPRTTRSPVDNFTFIKRVKAWLDAVESATKRKPVIYTNKSFWNAHGSSDFGEYPLWIPKFSKKLPGIQDLPRGWKRWTFWQFTDQAQFGPFGRVDGNIFDSLSTFESPR
jgi:lysozyme